LLLNVFSILLGLLLVSLLQNVIPVFSLFVSGDSLKLILIDIVRQLFKGIDIIEELRFVLLVHLLLQLSIGCRVLIAVRVRT